MGGFHYIRITSFIPNMLSTTEEHNDLMVYANVEEEKTSLHLVLRIAQNKSQELFGRTL